MINIETKFGICQIPQSVEELPDISKTQYMFCDFETTSEDPKKEAYYPYLGHRIAGVALLREEEQNGWYIPLRHKFPQYDFDRYVARKFLQALNQVPLWINHNVKFDAHFLYCEIDEVYQGRMIDTIILSKILYSDRYSHDLKTLCRDLLGMPMEEETWIKNYLKKIRSKNYGDVPADRLGQYAVMDVFGNRKLYHWFNDNFIPELNEIRDIEERFTPVLYDMERDGLKLNKLQTQIEGAKSLYKRLFLAEKIGKIAGQEFTNSNENIHDILCNKYLLPPIDFTDTTKGTEDPQASFKGEILEKYLGLPEVLGNKELSELIESILQYRSEINFYGLFVDPSLNLSDKNDFVHPSFNQIVRTGRTSCAKPNLQQQNERAKELFKPRNENYAFLSKDASQIEFRLIVHYIKDVEAIEAFRRDPYTDFHQWVADLIHIERDPAKTINFAIAYGAGKAKIKSEIRQQKSVIDEINYAVDVEIAAGILHPSKRGQRIDYLLGYKAGEILDSYFARLPNLKLIKDLATSECKTRGYTFNLFGRRRYLDTKKAHNAFNTSIQGGASDFVKTRLIALSYRYNSKMRDLGIIIPVQVHDEILFEGPKDVITDPEVRVYIDNTLMDCSKNLRVPLVWSEGYSPNNWKLASGKQWKDGAKINLDALNPIPKLDLSNKL